ncbi:F-box and WD domain protein, putative [Entamoeba dispar SAW760]|uniref:F-box and WD domain protein, putative n=1 Tax=Entamoeba dispar (strain ATCC PRA-260 / SAW760) TaxID=370354 RepID=B0EQG6_ENTDS|nr:F-box and WD domain protein, putative [Entamoeba dispar SAW760]EDR23221.1 F-box and WD domain protein, putative [Entamoeba dispar SAW760]|eukprot:EDR23221.1 F-box and WD domain protein, putative [Entamoeba dispar SAW760]
MNQFTTDDIIKDLEYLNKRIHNKECTKKKKVTIESIPFTIGYLKKEGGLDVIVIEGVIPTKTIELYEFFLNFETYVQYLPFIYKLNFIQKDNIFDLVVEMEFNLIGFNKNALCLKRVIKKFTDKTYILSLSVTHDKSKIIPFRDSAILMQAITLEETKGGCLISDYEIIQPIPWLQSNDINESLERFSYIPIRRMKSCFDYLKYDKTLERINIINTITIERIGLELTLNGKHDSIGEVWYDSNNTRITCVEFVCDQASFIVEGSIQKICEFRLSRETLIELVFQDRCRVVETTDSLTTIFHKSCPNSYQNDGEDISFSSFIYSENCALVYFKSLSTLSSQEENKGIQKYNFGPSYIYVCGCEGTWNIQFNVKVVAKTTLPRLNDKVALHAMLEFLRNIELSFQKVSPVHNYKQPLTIITSTDPVIPPLLKIQLPLMVKISRYFTKEDMTALSRTNKQLKEMMEYCSKLVIQNKPLPQQHPFYYTEHPLQNSSQCFYEEWKGATPKHSVLTGHTNLIRALDISDDCSLLVSGSSDRKIRLWNLQDESSRTFVGPNSCLVSTKFIMNNFIASGYHCGTIKYINWSDSRESQVFDVNEGKLEGFLPLRDMDFIVWNEKITAYRYSDMRQTLLFTYSGHQRKVQIVKPFSSLFLSGSADRTIQLWDPSISNPRISKIKGHKSGIVGLEQISPYSFVSAGNDRLVHYWDIRELTHPTHSVKKKICNMTYNNKALICGGESGEVYIFPTDNPTQSITLNSYNTSGLISITSKKNIICCGFKDGTISMWRY